MLLGVVLVVDRYLDLLDSELKIRRSVRVTLQERLLHEDYLIKDIERQILEYKDSKVDVDK
jgi:hypothetical protein